MSGVIYPINNKEYTAEDVEIFNCTRTNGVYSVLDFDYVLNGSVLTVDKGLAWIKNGDFKGKAVAFTEPETLVFDSADSTLDRYDVVAVRYDATKTEPELVIIKGTASETPVIPTRTTESYLYELFLYSVLRKAGESSPSLENIEDLRENETYCGIMRDSVTSMVAPVYETITEDVLNVGDKINFDAEKYEFLIATAHTTTAEANVILTKTMASVSLKTYFSGTGFYKSESGNVYNFYVQFSTDNNTHKLILCDFSVPDEATGVAEITKLVGAVKQPEGYVRVDSLYNPKSKNAQSGEAVAEAVAEAVTEARQITETATNEVKEEIKKNFDVVRGVNLYNPATIEPNTFMYANGEKYSKFPQYLLTDYIPVTEGRTIYATYTRALDNNRNQAEMRYITAFNSNFEVLAEQGTDVNVKTYTVPDGVAYIRVSVNSAFWNEFQLAYDKINIPYEPYEELSVLKIDRMPDVTTDKIAYQAVTTEKIADGSVISDKIPDNEISGEKISKYYYCSIPEKLYVRVGERTQIYFNNLYSLPKMKVRFKPVSSLTSKYMSDYFEITANSEGNFVVYWYIYDDNYQMVENGEMLVVAKSSNLKDTTALVLGDSTVNAGKVTQTMLDEFDESGKTLTLLGTRGSAPNLHEGRGGWKASDYCTKETIGSYTNAFYNPDISGFDFSYYMTQQGYSDVEYVVIQLGINDTFAFTFENYNSTEILANFETIINSILDYDDSIKIILNVTIPPNSNVDTFGQAYGASQIEFVYRANVIRFAKELMARFENIPNITLCSTNVVIDTATQIRDGVHPTDEGYEAMGNQVINTINYVQNKS